MAMIIIAIIANAIQKRFNFWKLPVFFVQPSKTSIKTAGKIKNAYN
jgi:hypothetical protein